jgi:hypothetical protein
VAGEAEGHAVSDPQKDALYAWEDEWWGWNISVLTLSECRKVIRAACAVYQLPPPRVMQHKTRSISYSQGDVISLQAEGPRVVGGHKGGKNFATCLHEAAHYIHGKLHPNDAEDHSPEFMGVYLHLLVTAKIAPAEAIYGSARARGLKWKSAK